MRESRRPTGGPPRRWNTSAKRAARCSPPGAAARLFSVIHQPAPLPHKTFAFQAFYVCRSDVPYRRGRREATQNTAVPSAIRSVPSRSVAWIPWPPGRLNRAERFSSLKPTTNVPTTSATSASHRATGLSLCSVPVSRNGGGEYSWRDGGDGQERSWNHSRRDHGRRGARCRLRMASRRFEDHLRPFYFEACGFAPTKAGWSPCNSPSQRPGSTTTRGFRRSSLSRASSVALRSAKEQVHAPASR